MSTENRDKLLTLLYDKFTWLVANMNDENVKKWKKVYDGQPYFMLPESYKKEFNDFAQQIEEAVVSI